MQTIFIYVWKIQNITYLYSPAMLPDPLCYSSIMCLSCFINVLRIPDCVIFPGNEVLTPINICRKDIFLILLLILPIPWTISSFSKAKSFLFFFKHWYWVFSFLCLVSSYLLHRHCEETQLEELLMDRGPGPPQTSPFLPVRSAFSLLPDSWIWKNDCPSRLKFSFGSDPQ